MSKRAYEPADHVPWPRQALAAWAIFAALLVTAFGANVVRAELHGSGGHRASQARAGDAVVATPSAWLHAERAHRRPVCAPAGLS
jgi:hypothetical protein